MRFKNIRDVKTHPEGYTCTLDVAAHEILSKRKKDLSVYETMDFFAKRGGGGICDAVIAAIEAGKHKGAIGEWSPPQKHPAAKRLESLAEKWADPFALLDDILERGTAAVKADRDAIKAAHPKT